MRTFRLSFRLVIACLAVYLSCILPLRAGTTAPETGAPSVHLRFQENDVSSFYSEVTVKRSAPGSYFAVTGWHNGYFGLQERSDGSKVLLFSVWGSAQNNARGSPTTVSVISKDAAVRTAEFNNEGSGIQAFLDYDWKPNTTYAFMVKAKQIDDRAEYSGYFRPPDSKRWRLLVTLSTQYEATLLRGLHSFVEDFKRDEQSARAARRAVFSNAWSRKQDGSTRRLLAAVITTAPPNARGVDAEVSAAGFTLVTGGNTENVTTSLGRRVDRVQSINDELPGDL